MAGAEAPQVCDCLYDGQGQLVCPPPCAAAAAAEGFSVVQPGSPAALQQPRPTSAAWAAFHAPGPGCSARGGFRVPTPTAAVGLCLCPVSAPLTDTSGAGRCVAGGYDYATGAAADYPLTYRREPADGRCSEPGYLPDRARTQQLRAKGAAYARFGVCSACPTGFRRTPDGMCGRRDGAIQTLIQPASYIAVLPPRRTSG